VVRLVILAATAPKEEANTPTLALVTSHATRAVTPATSAVIVPKDPSATTAVYV
jgi:hypothetical protein